MKTATRTKLSLPTGATWWESGPFGCIEKLEEKAFGDNLWSFVSLNCMRLNNMATSSSRPSTSSGRGIYTGTCNA